MKQRMERRLPFLCMRPAKPLPTRSANCARRWISYAIMRRKLHTIRGRRVVFSPVSVHGTSHWPFSRAKSQPPLPREMAFLQNLRKPHLPLRLGPLRISIVRVYPKHRFSWSWGQVSRLATRSARIQKFLALHLRDQPKQPRPFKTEWPICANLVRR